ncbi:hypothetical protein K456DRAFT_888801 [Colletotrichum gloeosporioides 23]|nr:hypothetical protein K456DRAFT_888801 [Colletotrichum gloeosporioides 23]
MHRNPRSKLMSDALIISLESVILATGMTSPREPGSPAEFLTSDSLDQNPHPPRPGIATASICNATSRRSTPRRRCLLVIISVSLILQLAYLPQLADVMMTPLFAPDVTVWNKVLVFI